VIGTDTHAYRRDLPHLENAGKTYFVTFRTFRRTVLPPVARDVALHCCVHDHRITYFLHCAVVMPDHVHVLFTPHDEWLLAQITHRLKGVSAKWINRAFNSQGHVWQHESFDHILRSEESIRQIAEYICENPVRAGLVEHADAYHWLWREWVEGRVAPPTRQGVST